MRTTVGALVAKKTLYAFIYGAEGVGKTRVALSLAGPKGAGAAYVTAEESGPTSLLSVGATQVPVEVLPPPGQNPFPTTIKALDEFARDPQIKVICLDGLTVMCGHAVDFLSSGQGEKALGFQGWQEILANFRAVEAACDKAKRAGKHVIMTAWEQPPTYENQAFGGGQVMTAEGRPLLQGRAKEWMPGKCDIVARMTSKLVTGKDAAGKTTKQWQGLLHTQRDGNWLAKSRWELPHPFPADLGKVLAHLETLGAPKAPTIAPAVMGAKRVLNSAHK